MQLVEQTVNYIYNIQDDSAAIYIDSVEKVLPRHPVTPMMKAIEVLWMNIPLVTIDTVFDKFKDHLHQVIKLSERMDGGRQEHPEAIFFEMAARGLLAEYYADDDQYMKAVSEANKTYQLLKLGFKLSDKIPEFLFTSGIYNYFREKYPEKHPIYKPFVWFFRSGDIELGLRQIKRACKETTISRVEAYVYLAFIYLRYEYKPIEAQKYLGELHQLYPNNPYIKAKLLESFADGKNFGEVSKELIGELIEIDRPYYQLAGNAFLGLHEEKVDNDPGKALIKYERSLASGELIAGHGNYYRSLAHLGAGRIYMKSGHKEKAEMHLEKSREYAVSEVVADEAKGLLDQL